MRSVPFLLFAVLWIHEATAQVSPNLSDMEPGTVFNFRASNGNSVNTYIGPDGAFHRFRMVRDNSKGEPVDVTQWVDDQGRTVRAVFNDLELKFAPHDCWLEIGRCRFTVRNNYGEMFRMIQIGKLEGNTFSYQIFRGRVSNDTLQEHGMAVVDEWGMPLSRDYVDQSGTQHWSRRQ